MNTSTLTLVRRYITKNFDVYTNMCFGIQEKHTGDILSLNIFISEINDIFNINCKNICTEWYNSRLNQILANINKYLSKYRVVLTRTDWKVLDNNDNELNIDHMVNEFKDSYDEKFIRNLYNDWKLEKITKKTEEILKISGEI